MIILPDRKISRSKFLIPVPKKEWILPSDFTARDDFGLPGIRIKFTIKAVLNDGHVVWDSWFDDREDFDAFLWAIANNTLKYERELWDLPSVEWHDGIGEDVIYKYAITTTLSTIGAGTYTIPTDWKSDLNTVWGIGAGGNGAATLTTTVNAKSSGGGGGEARGIINFSSTPGTGISYVVGAAAAQTSRTGSASGTTTGGNGAPSTWNSTTLIAAGGSGGLGSTTTTATVAGTGGTGGIGTYGANGGTGAAVANAGSASGGGGAAAASVLYTTITITSYTAGVSSAAPSTTNTFSAGGNSGNGTLGATTLGGTGSSSSGSGGGGGAGMAASNATVAAGSGGAYGAGGGGCAIRSIGASRTATAGSGRSGIINVNYTPQAFYAMRNLPMLGM
jgi:hypothetical protein